MVLVKLIVSPTWYSASLIPCGVTAFRKPWEGGCEAAQASLLLGLFSRDCCVSSGACRLFQVCTLPGALPWPGVCSKKTLICAFLNVRSAPCFSTESPALWVGDGAQWKSLPDASVQDHPPHRCTSPQGLPGLPHGWCSAVVFCWFGGGWPVGSSAFADRHVCQCIRGGIVQIYSF